MQETYSLSTDSHLTFYELQANALLAWLQSPIIRSTTKAIL